MIKFIIWIKLMIAYFAGVKAGKQEEHQANVEAVNEVAQAITKVNANAVTDKSGLVDRLRKSGL